MEDITRGKVPTAFLSSTCYDLKQIRTDIKKFFEENLGFDIFYQNIHHSQLILKQQQ